MTSTPHPKPPVIPPAEREPDVTQEESIPSDGKDEVGEKMMEKLGKERGVDPKPRPNE